MMLKFLSKFVLDILPPVTATIIGAFIVTHYINPQSHSDAAKADAARAAVAAAASSEPKTATPEAATSKTPTLEKTASTATPGEALVKPVEAASESKTDARTKPLAAASAQAEARRHATAIREAATARDKASAKPAPATVAAGNAPIVAVSTGEPSPANADEHRDANDIARAAIERLRSTASADRPASERLPEPPRSSVKVATGSAAPQLPLAAPPLPPAVNVSASPIVPSFSPEDDNAADSDDRNARRSGSFLPPIPPADIPLMQRPLNIQASTQPDNGPSNDGVFGVMRSVFRAVTPH
jgi:hypothetical protein